MVELNDDGKAKTSGIAGHENFINVSTREEEEANPLENYMVNEFQGKPNNGKCCFFIFLFFISNNGKCS